MCRTPSCVPAKSGPCCFLAVVLRSAEPADRSSNIQGDSCSTKLVSRHRCRWPYKRLSRPHRLVLLHHSKRAPTGWSCHTTASAHTTSSMEPEHPAGGDLQQQALADGSKPLPAAQAAGPVEGVAVVSPQAQFYVQCFVDGIADYEAAKGAPLTPQHHGILMQHFLAMYSGPYPPTVREESQHLVKLLRAFAQGSPLPPIPSPKATVPDADQTQNTRPSLAQVFARLEVQWRQASERAGRPIDAQSFLKAHFSPARVLANISELEERRKAGEDVKGKIEHYEKYREDLQDEPMSPQTIEVISAILKRRVRKGAKPPPPKGTLKSLLVQGVSPMKKKSPAKAPNKATIDSLTSALKHMKPGNAHIDDLMESLQQQKLKE